jgi:hypothetical protein
MSPLPAKVKCPHYGGLTNFESKAVEAVASFEDGVRGGITMREATLQDGGELASCYVPEECGDTGLANRSRTR